MRLQLQDGTLIEPDPDDSHQMRMHEMDMDRMREMIKANPLGAIQVGRQANQRRLWWMHRRGIVAIIGSGTMWGHGDGI